MYYLRARYYEPEIGRFVVKDPLWGRRTRSDPTNPYNYCNNCSIMHVDPSRKEALHDLVFVLERKATLTVINCQASASAIATYTIILPRMITNVAIMVAMTIGPAMGEMITEMINAADEEDNYDKNHPEQTMIYRWGSNTYTNLTPREIDTTGLSFSTVKPPPGKRFVATTMELINKTNVLIAIKDGPTHVSVKPLLPHTMKAWIASRVTAEINPHPYTILLKKMVVSGG